MGIVIGVTSAMEVEGTAFTVGADNIYALKEAGGVPIVLPNVLEESAINRYAQILDGLYLTGGYDIDPSLFGEEPHKHLGMITPIRDTFERLLIQQILSLNKPILGVCRGCQILNIAVGGQMYQDIYGQINRDILQHSQQAPAAHGSHTVHVLKGSLLHRLTGQDRLRVNSRHHQANRTVIDTFQVSGKANDDIIEAIESTAHAFVLGLQWHPENMAVSGDKCAKRIFKAFIEACSIRKGAS